MQRILAVLLSAGLLLTGCGASASSSAAQAQTAETTAVEESTFSAAAESSQQAETAAEEESTVSGDTESSEQQTPEHVVALSKSNASLWLLAGGSLVGTTQDAMDLEGLSDDVTDLGDMDSVSEEAVLDLDPDLVILFSSDPSQNALGEQLSDLGIRVEFMNIDTFQDYADVMKEFTDLTGRSDLYEENVTKVQEEIEEIENEVPENEKGQTYLTLKVSATKNKVLKEDDFTSEIFDNLGLVNIAADTSSLDDMSIEAIKDAEPDWIFVIPRGTYEKAMQSFTDSFEDQPAWQSLEAVKNDHVVILPKELFSLKPNDKWAQAYQTAYDAVYGGETS